LNLSVYSCMSMCTEYYDFKTFQLDYDETLHPIAGTDCPLLEVITFGYHWPLEMGPQIVKLKI